MPEGQAAAFQNFFASTLTSSEPLSEDATIIYKFCVGARFFLFQIHAQGYAQILR